MGYEITVRYGELMVELMIKIWNMAFDVDRWIPGMIFLACDVVEEDAQAPLSIRCSTLSQG